MHKLIAHKILAFLSKPILASFIFFLIAAIGITFLLGPSKDTNIKKQSFEIFQLASKKVVDINYILYSRIGVNRALSAYIEQNPDLSQKEFDSFVNSLLNIDGGIVSSMSFQKDFIISLISPPKYYDKAIGYDLRKKPALIENLHHSILENKAFLEGPIELENDIYGIVSYIPVFVFNDNTNEEEVVGIADVVFL